MNRIVEVCGITPSNSMDDGRKERLEAGKDNTDFYTDFAKMVLGSTYKYSDVYTFFVY